MSYETIVEQVKTLPEACLEDVAKYLDYLLYRYAQEKMLPLIETNEEFEIKMHKGFTDMKEGNVTPIREAFSEIKSRFS